MTGRVASSDLKRSQACMQDDRASRSAAVHVRSSSVRSASRLHAQGVSPPRSLGLDEPLDNHQGDSYNRSESTPLTVVFILIIVACTLFVSAFWSALVFSAKHRDIRLGLLLGAVLGPIGFLIACFLPSMREEDRIRAEVERIRIKRKAQSIVESEGLIASANRPTGAEQGSRDQILVSEVILGVVMIFSILLIVLSFLLR